MIGSDLRVTVMEKPSRFPFFRTRRVETAGCVSTGGGRSGNAAASSTLEQNFKKSYFITAAEVSPQEHGDFPERGERTAAGQLVGQQQQPDSIRSRQPRLHRHQQRRLVRRNIFIS